MVPAEGANRLFNRPRMHSYNDPRPPDEPGIHLPAVSHARSARTDDSIDGDSNEEPSGDESDDRQSSEGFDYDDDLDEQFPLGDGVVETAAEVWCPYCGEPSEMNVDPGGGSPQNYVEDCPVCCRPWQVTVYFSADGSVTVACEADDASLDDLD